MPSVFRSRLGALAAAAALVLALPACDHVDPEERPPPPEGTLFAGVNFTTLFAPPTPTEVQAVLADWAGRNPSSSNASVVAEAEVGGATLAVVEHTVTSAGAPDVTHYGVVRIPAGASEAPVLVVHHGGDNGFSISALTSNTGVLQFAGVFAPIAEEAVLVFPVYRSETINTEAVPTLGGPYTASGDPSPWDYDVDDSMALLSAAFELFGDETDDGRVAAIGFSRGANTAVLQAVRDPRLDAVVDYYGPTDFYNESAFQLAQAILLPESNPSFQQAIQLPAAQFLLDNVLDPLRNADDTFNPNADYGPARLDVLRRSPGIFASALPDTRVHHHFRDGVVPFTFSQAFAERVGGAAESFDVTFYGAPPTSQADLDFLFHVAEATPDMRASIPDVLAFLAVQLEVTGGGDGDDDGLTP